MPELEHHPLLAAGRMLSSASLPSSHHQNVRCCCGQLSSSSPIPLLCPCRWPLRTLYCCEDSLQVIPKDHHLPVFMPLQYVLTLAMPPSYEIADSDFHLASCLPSWNMSLAGCKGGYFDVTDSSHSNSSFLRNELASQLFNEKIDISCK